MTGELQADATARGACVVVSTYNRADLLPRLVAALSSQTQAAFEVAIVDNGSDDETPEVLVSLTAGLANFRILRLEENRGPARARNLGWRSTDRPLVVFTDDDCVPTPGWLTALVEAAAEADIVQGQTLPLHEPGYEFQWFERFPVSRCWTGRYETCNLLIHRWLLAELLGFDESFSTAMGEDTDLGLRAERRGASTVFAPGALVHHHVWQGGFRAFLRHVRRHADLVRLFRVNPAARRQLRWGFVVRPVHLLAWALLPAVGLAVWVRMPWIPLVVVAAWCVKNAVHTRHLAVPWYQRLRYSAMQFVGYAYEGWCFAVASIRHRTLVL